MSFVTVTKPSVGEPTRKPLVDLIIDNLTDLNARLSAFATSAIANGSFEFDADGDGIPDGWTRTLYTGGSSAISTSQHISGDQSFSFTSTVLANGGGELEQTDFSVVAGGKYYMASVWVWASVANVSHSAEVRWYDSAQSFISASVITSSNNSPTTATNTGLALQAPATARFAKVRLIGGVPAGGSATGTIYFDGVMFDEFATDTGRITEAALEASAVSQSKLKSSSATVTTGNETLTLITLTGGNYAFRGRASTDTGSIAAFCDLVEFSTTSTSGIFRVGLYSNPSTPSGVARFHENFVDASPPYNLGYGDIPIFIMLHVDASGRVISASVSPTPVWAFNGPTNIVPDMIDAFGRKLKRVKRFIAEFGSVEGLLKSGLPRSQLIQRLNDDPMELTEITQAVKNADMALIPHPFDPPGVGERVIMLDPLSIFAGKALDLFQSDPSGAVINDLLHAGYVMFDQDSLDVTTPPGVMTVRARWKLTP